MENTVHAGNGSSSGEIITSFFPDTVIETQAADTETQTRIKPPTALRPRFINFKE